MKSLLEVLRNCKDTFVEVGIGYESLEELFVSMTAARYSLIAKPFGEFKVLFEFDGKSRNYYCASFSSLREVVRFLLSSDCSEILYIVDESDLFVDTGAKVINIVGTVFSHEEGHWFSILPRYKDRETLEREVKGKAANLVSYELMDSAVIYDLKLKSRFNELREYLNRYVNLKSALNCLDENTLDSEKQRLINSYLKEEENNLQCLGIDWHSLVN